MHVSSKAFVVCAADTDFHNVGEAYEHTDVLVYFSAEAEVIIGLNVHERPVDVIEFIVEFIGEEPCKVACLITGLFGESLRGISFFGKFKDFVAEGVWVLDVTHGERECSSVGAAEGVKVGRVENRHHDEYSKRRKLSVFANELSEQRMRQEIYLCVQESFYMNFMLAALTRSSMPRKETVLTTKEMSSGII